MITPKAGLDSHVPGQAATSPVISTPVVEDDGWPKLPGEALYGLAGDIVKIVDPYTEADPAAILTNLLIGFGNMVGAGPHYCVEFDRHSLRLNAVMVGESSKGRKGQSLSTPKRILTAVDAKWADRITSGLSSGEGLIYAVRDSDGVDDAGEPDKRLFIVEEEFAQPLKMMQREGNILSVTIRDAWDKGDLHPLTKTNRIAATGAHISIIGHITRHELLKLLSETEQANGFGNRFLWLRVRRSKVIPDPVPVSDEILAPLLERMRKAMEFGKALGEIKRSPVAASFWEEIYPKLSEGKPLLVGSLLNRAEAQVMRIACIYAVLDQSCLVEPDHLKAALAIWDFVEASVRGIFGDRLGDEIADRIIRALRDSRELDETALHALFNRNVPGPRIQHALDLLIQLGLAEATPVTTAGRPRIVWRATN